MANVKISQLPSLSTMTNVAQIPVVAGGTTYQITGANLQNYFVGTYGNANVVANVAALGSNPVSTAGNVTGAYVFGNGSQLTGLPATYGNANVVANLAALGSNPVSTTGNITGAYIFGNGSQLTGITVASTYGNANVAANLAAFANNPISTTGNVTGGNILTGGLIFVVGNITAGNIKTYTGAAAGAVDALFLRSQALTGGGRIVFNNTNGELIDSANLSFSGTQLSITGAISASGNIAGGNILGGANVNATTHTGTTVSVTGNITGGNVSTAGLISATGNITGGNVNTGVITLTNGAVIKDNAGDSVAFGQSAGGTSQGNSSVALGHNAGETGQGTFAVAIGRNAGQNTQGGGTVAVGVSAGGETQGNNAIAIGSSAGFTGQGSYAVGIGIGAGQTNQGVDAVAIGNSAGSLTQGIAAVAIGTLAGRTFQANNSIIINATGANLDQTTANTFTVAPVRNDVANIGNVIFYNATSKEITYGNTIGVAGNITSGNLSAVNLVINNIRSDDSSFVNIEDGVNVTGAIDASGNITGGYILGNGSQLTGVNAVTVDVTDTNGLTTIYYPTFVENRTTAQIARADVDLTYRTDDNLLTVGNVSVTGNITGGNLTVGSGTITGGNVNGANFNGNVAFGTGTVGGSGNITGGNLLTSGLISATGNVSGNYFIGNGAALTGIAASVPGQTILPTVQTITVEARPAGLFGGGQGGANVTVANVIPVTEYGVIITAGTISETYKTGALGSIPGTVSLTFTTGLNSTQYTVFAYVTSNAGTFYSNSATGTSGICLLAGTQIALSDGTHKAIEHITYTDKLLSWDFDRGCYAETTAIWIKRGETGSQYNLLTFSDGTTLRTFDQHRIFNKQAGAFTYPMTSATPVGTATVNEHGQEIILTNKQVIQDTIEYYNVITDYHMNLFSDSVLTSCRFNNIYPITDMKFVKDSRTLRTRAEFENVPDRFFHGLRLAEQTTDVGTVEWYVNRLLSTEVSTESELAV
jgi:hypothetical protein